MRQAAYIKIGVLAIIETALIAVFSIPIQTHAVLVEVPPGGSFEDNLSLLDRFLMLAPVLLPILMLGALIVPIWLAIRLIRTERQRK